MNHQKMTSSGATVKTMMRLISPLQIAQDLQVIVSVVKARKTVDIQAHLTTSPAVRSGVTKEVKLNEGSAVTERMMTMTTRSRQEKIVDIDTRAAEKITNSLASDIDITATRKQVQTDRVEAQTAVPETEREGRRSRRNEIGKTHLMIESTQTNENQRDTAVVDPRTMKANLPQRRKQHSHLTPLQWNFLKQPMNYYIISPIWVNN